MNKHSGAESLDYMKTAKKFVDAENMGDPKKKQKLAGEAAEETMLIAEANELTKAKLASDIMEEKDKDLLKRGS